MRSTAEGLCVGQLSRYLADYMGDRNWTIREAAEQFGISKTALAYILSHTDAVPTLETLSKIADGVELPLGKIIELCGFKLEPSPTPNDQIRRLASLIEHAPDYRPLMDRLLALRPDDVEGVLAYIDAVEARRARRDMP